MKLACISAALVALCASCVLIDTQNWPPPMTGPQGDALPPDPHPHEPGPEEVTIIRHADPVQFRPAGSFGAFPLAFYDKRIRATAGSCVIVSAGGRAEIIWPSGASVMMFDEGVGWVESPSRGEPLFSFQSVTGAQLNLIAGNNVRLLGGAMLAGESGPIVISHPYYQVLVVENQTRTTVRIAYLEERIDLTPGQIITLPVVSSGTAPKAVDPERRRVSGPGFGAWIVGPVTPQGEEGSASFSASGDATVSALGVEVKLVQGQQATFSPLGAEANPPSAPPTSSTPTVGDAQPEGTATSASASVPPAQQGPPQSPQRR